MCKRGQAAAGQAPDQRFQPIACGARSSTIIPISDPRQDTAGVIKRAALSHEPVFITQHGRPRSWWTRRPTSAGSTSARSCSSSPVAQRRSRPASVATWTRGRRRGRASARDLTVRVGVTPVADGETAILPPRAGRGSRACEGSLATGVVAELLPRRAAG
ncbi:MAG: type II toxin-antitoxin system Phd/YefM family antitoxin [Actinomycetes bacterium]